ncbi:UDP-N-acetylmuramoyl-tripeptide--D-alanyl-D-alanine ligase [Halobacillus andaensis]|uniref:UDP-N-acetylmuramoyl-tripeptide--D-alanyl-D-alanine ligase n=1 Tax=Halobacillus andaensis TaxID=1176239 RepID=A0A917B055_HALAA|nr:UDP-N-acetylmuramoyl-tripeptide--D-alanyl-D-alanine ligase [Halobacillus andaensis]MBP2003587.1 UDP-N-acetylmuramoyl-tripeptide--D-alanyl-D-alanine ligase [Halobacillus andaensis]GGF11764.1 UDP-N-acetylmuramoyl-tripeptide--D-alanyl-D-alanine ligase [Halobacillus andaensis]
MFKVKELASYFPNGRGATQDSIQIREVMTDTRVEKKQSLFVPLVGENHDAHRFLMNAIKMGAVAALWQEDHELPKEIPTEFPVFFVEDTLRALQETSSFYLRKVNPVVVGITGSNGKTTTKDLTASVLQVKYRTHKTAGNFNNHVGMPLTILSMPLDTEVAVLEMGMSQAGEISLLSKLAQPRHVMITNIGESHIEYLGSREGIAKAKLEILDGWQQGSFIFDGDEELLRKYHQTPQAFACGFQSSSDVVINDIVLEENRSLFTIDEDLYELSMSGKHNVKNASYVVTLAKELGLTVKEIQTGLKQLQMSGMRFEKHMGLNGALIINDAYNASPTSMKATIEIILELKSKSKKILILGDMFELGAHADQLHKEVSTAITEEISAVYTVGEHAAQIIEGMKERNLDIETKHFKDKDSLSHHVQQQLNSDTVVLLKASRGMKLEVLLNDLLDE